MNNTHALLLAFIEASGYEVEEVPTKGSVIARDAFIAAGCAFDPPLKYDYKVTKKRSREDIVREAHIQMNMNTQRQELNQGADNRKCNRCGLGPASPSMNYCNDLNCGGTVK